MYWTSSTQWEKSLYGGFDKVLYDYPKIKTSYDLDYDFDKESKLPYYLKTKLADIAQLKIKQFKLEDYLAAGAKVEKRKCFFSGEEQKYIVPTKESLREVADYIKDHDAELGSLFEHYKDDLLNTKFYYKVDETIEKKLVESPTGDLIIPKGDKSIKSLIANIASETEKYEYKPFITSTFSADFDELKDRTTFFNVRTKVKGIRKIRYDSNEETTAKKLLDLLDVNFDPKTDKVDNLRNGKLDVAKIATVQSGNTRVYYKVEENISTKPFALCILMDESGSMDGYKKRQQHNLVKILYKTFSQILPKDKIYIYGHSGDSEEHVDPEIRIYHDPYNQNFEECFYAQMSEINFNENYDGIVIEKIYDEIRSKTSENILFISISDGQPSGCNYGGQSAVDEMKRVIEKCRRDGFVTVGIGFEYDGVKNIYSYSSTITNLQDSPKIVSTLLNKVVKLEFQNDEC